MSCWHNPTQNVFQLSFWKDGAKLSFRWEPNGYCDLPDEFDRLVKLEAPACKKVKHFVDHEPPKVEEKLEPKVAVKPLPAQASPKAEPPPKAPVESKPAVVVPASPKKEKK